MLIEAPAWVWLVPVWITVVICGTILLRDHLKRRRNDDDETRDATHGRE